MTRASDVLGASAPNWVSGRPYKPGDVMKSPADNYQAYVRSTAEGSGAIDPSADPTNYKPFGARAIKSIQRGVIVIVGVANVTATATVSAVNTNKSTLAFLGFSTPNGGNPGQQFSRLALTNATTVTATRAQANTGAQDVSVSWELVEYY